MPRRSKLSKPKGQHYARFDVIGNELFIYEHWRRDGTWYYTAWANGELVQEPEDEFESYGGALHALLCWCEKLN